MTGPLPRKSRRQCVTSGRVQPRFGARGWLAAVAIVLLQGGYSRAAGAETVSLAKRQAMAERAAVADAYRQLRIEAGALSLGESRTVDDLAAASASIAIGIRRLVAQAERDGRARRYANGDVEMDLRLPLGSFIEGLGKLHAAVESPGPVTAADLDALAKRVGATSLIVTGQGQLPTDDALTGPPGWPGGREAGELPPAGWANVSSAGFRAAERAAELDAIDHLTRRIAELKMERSGTVGDLIAAAPAVGQGLRQPFTGVKVTQAEFLPEQVCRLYAEVSVTDVVARLLQLRSKLEGQSAATEGDIKSIARLATVRRLRAAGYGLPPVSTRTTDPYAVIDLDEPAWAGKSLRAVGTGALPQFEPPADRAIQIATQDARIAAQLKLAEQIDGLELPGGAAVGAFLARHEALAADILTFLSAARPAGPPKVDKERHRVTVTMTLPLRRLWLILRNQIPTVESPTSRRAASE